MIKVPNLIEQYVPIARRDRKVAKALTGVTISAVEAFILCPVERVKVFMMTRSTQESVYSRLTSNHNLVKELYKGYLPLFTRQTVAWVTFLSADQYMKQVCREHLGLTRE